MKSIKSILVLAIVVVLGNTAIAQQKQLTDEQKAQMKIQMQEFQEKLNLSDDQKEEVKDISEKYTPQLMALKESNKSRMSKYKEYKSIVKNRNSEMKKVLTDDQYDTYLEIQEEMKKKMKQRRK